MNNINDFKIEDGVLIKYTGSDACVEIPESVISIKSYAFSWCKGLKCIKIPCSVTLIEEFAICNCCELECLVADEGNPKYYSKGNCVIEAETKALVLGCKNSIIPPDGSVTSIGSTAFDGCSALEAIVIPESVTSIGSFAFNDCKALKEIFIPKKVNLIGAYAFSGCDSLERIEVDKACYEYYSKGNCIIRGGYGRVVVGCKNSEIPSDGSIRGIDNFAFNGCTMLESIIIPNSVEWIGDHSFSGCDCLDNVVIPDSVIGIGEGAFSSCHGIESITIPDSVTIIGKDAFSECPNLIITTVKDSFAEEYAKKNNIAVKQ